MAASSVKEKVVITAAEPETATINTSTGSIIYYSQRCLLCKNTRELPEGMHYCSTPWVCNECKEAIAYVKDIRASVKEVSAEQQKEIEVGISLL